MSDSTKNPNINAGGQSDPLVDSILRQFADTQGEADEDFLAQVESSIDESEIIVPIARSLKWRKSLAWASGIAAVIAIGMGAWFTTVTYEKKYPGQPQIVATVSDESLMEIETLGRPVRTSRAIVATSELSSNQPSVGKPDESNSFIWSESEVTDEGRIAFTAGTGSKGKTLTPNDGYNGNHQGRGQAAPIMIDDTVNISGRMIRRELPISPGEEIDTAKVTYKREAKSELRYTQRGYVDPKSDGLGVSVPPSKSMAKPSTTVVTAGGTIALGGGGKIRDSLDTSIYEIAKEPAVVGLITAAPSKMMFGQKMDSPTQTSLATTLGRSPTHPTGSTRTPNPVESRSTRYGSLIDNAWTSPLNDPLSTFSIDVDTASWTNVRGMIRSGITADQIPNDAIRIEEMINYFDWDYPQPKGDHPFAFAVEEAACPWNADNRLLRVGIQGMEAPKRKRPDANLVFLLDVSGSMNQPNKLPLVKKAISILVEELDENDRVTMVVYAGAEGVALPPTSGRNQAAISAALRKLNAGGSTNGGAGIKLAYKLAAEQFVKDGINRVILCTDGDFNVGLTGNDELVKMVERKAKSGVFLSVCGFGQDNLNDSMLEKITNKGNGNYFFIDTPREARKVFLKDMMGTLLTIAKDVKIQMEFNPAKVAAYRLIGYANRRLNAEDFENDKVDAGEVGSGHSVTALYEVIPVGSENDPRSKITSNLRYQKEVAPPKPEPKREIIPSDELALLKLRYKRPDGEVSIPMEQAIMPSGKNFKAASNDYQFASAVALFGMILREHESVKGQGISDVLELAEKGMGNDPHGYRAEFVKVVRKLKVADKE